MTAVAGCGRLIPAAVGRRLASGLPAAMAGLALARHSRPMVIARTQPGRCVEVAALAGGVGHNMRMVLGCRQDTFADRMTFVTIPGRSFEHPADVTCFT